MHLVPSAESFHYDLNSLKSALKPSLSFAATSNGKSSSPTRIREKVTMPCPALQDVVGNDGTFDIIYWSRCTSRTCDHKDTKWDWIAGMNNKGIIKVGRERVNITRDGALEIHQVNLSDAGQYMCTVKTINHSSPGVHHTTLVVTEKAEKGTFKLCFWPLVGLARIKLVQAGT